MASNDDNSAWAGMDVWSVDEAAYICDGCTPMTSEERKKKNTPIPASVVAMRRRLLAAVASNELPCRNTSRDVPAKPYFRPGSTREWPDRWEPPRHVARELLFKRTDVEVWAQKNRIRLLYQAGTLESSERDKLLKQVAVLALVLAEKSNHYRRGSKPNANQIAEAAQDILAAWSGFEQYKHGTSASSIRDSIRAGIKLLGVLPPMTAGK